MREERPRLVVLAGPNGAGKSTGAPALLQGTLAVDEYVNADVIAQGLSAFHPECVSFEAGRLMLRRMRELAEQRVSFAFETTLATKSFLPWITRLRSEGFLFFLVFLWLPSPEMAIARVAERVRFGGHSVPEDTVRRRYWRGLRNFFHLYKQHADLWCLLENSNREGARLIAHGSRNADQLVYDVPCWDRIVKGATDAFTTTADA